MSKDRQATAEKIVREAAAEFISREAGPQSLITVTRVALEDDFSRATIYLSVLPEEKEQMALGLLQRNTQEFKDYLKEKTKFPRRPYVEFVLDRGEKNRQRLDELSN